MENKKIYYLDDVAQVFGLSRGAVRMRLFRGDAERGHFPAPFRLGGEGSRLGWLPEDVDAFFRRKSQEVRATGGRLVDKKEEAKISNQVNVELPPRPRGRPKKSASVKRRRDEKHAG